MQQIFRRVPQRLRRCSQAAARNRWHRCKSELLLLRAASTCSSSSLPVIDISPFLSSDTRAEARVAEERRRVASELHAACRDVGFFYLVGHGVPQRDIDEVHAVARRFFELPMSDKGRIAISRCPQSGRGYQRLGENVTKGQRDWHEAIDFYAEMQDDTVDLGALAQSPGQATRESLEGMRPFVFGKNQWPSEPSEFQAKVEAHFARATRLGEALMDATAIALELPADYFRPLTDRSFWTARVIGYPPLADGREHDASVGDSVGEHTDYGCWTILAQDDTPGALEVRLASGEWVVAEPMQGAFVVNLGDMLSVWTRKRFAATPHRVRHRHPGRYRTSIAFFFEPNFDAVIEPLKVSAVGDASDQPPLSSAGNTAPLERAMRGGGLVYGEHLFAKVSSNFDFSEEESR